MSLTPRPLHLALLALLAASAMAQAPDVGWPREVKAADGTVITVYQPQLERSGVTIGLFGFVQAAMSLSQVAVLQNVERLERAAGSKRRASRRCTTSSARAWPSFSG